MSSLHYICFSLKISFVNGNKSAGICGLVQINIWNSWYKKKHHTLWNAFIVPPKIRGILFLKFGQRGGSWKNCSEIGGSVERGGFRIVSSVFLEKSMFSLLLEYFFV